MLKRFFRILAFTAILFAPLMASCKKHVQHPGTANAFDSDAYDTLLVTHSVIESTKTDLVNNAFPASIVGNVFAALNGLIRAYNVLDTIYCGQPVSGPQAALQCAPNSYHAMAIAGTATPAQSAAVQLAVSDVNGSTVSLSNAKAGKP